MGSPPVVAFKDLCIDVGDEATMTAFWAGALGLRPVVHATGVQLVGDAPEQGVWLNRVPEAPTVKQRVHLDLHAASVAELEALGAAVRSAPGELPWTVLTDPEGGELCAFVRDHPPAYRLCDVVVDCVDPHGIASWWAVALGAQLVDDGRGFASVRGIPGAPFGSLDFVPVPEPKTVKNRIHWDVTARRGGAVDELRAAGAALLREPGGDISWTVMADPEGNEFCVFATR